MSMILNHRISEKVIPSLHINEQNIDHVLHRNNSDLTANGAGEFDVCIAYTTNSDVKGQTINVTGG